MTNIPTVEERVAEHTDPDTTWHSTLVGVVAMIAVTFIIYVVMSLIS